MSSKGQLDRVTGLLQQQLITAPPRIDEVQIEVRTNGVVRPEPPMAQGAPELFGEFVLEWSFDVGDAELPRFQEALLEAEKVLGTVAAGAAGACPEGVRYLGTYFVISGGAPGVGRYRTLWAYRDWATFQAFHDRAKIGDSEFAQALRLLTLYQSREWPKQFITTITTRAVGLRPIWATPAIAGHEAGRKRRGRAPRKRP